MDLFNDGEFDPDDADEDTGSGFFENAPASAPEGLLPPRETIDCIGHGAVEKAIMDLHVAGRMPHAMIFSGPHGIGKATMAFRVARFLLKHGTEESGGLFGPAEPPASLSVAPDDPVFRRVASGGHPDLLDIGLPEGKSALPVEDVRRIAPFLRMTASGGGWRVVIVDDADTMSRSGQNAILKILEEPPPRTLLILIASRLGAMIPTIRSRCRVMAFQPLDRETIVTLLRKTDPSATTASLNTVAAMAEGSAGKAMTYLQEGGPDLLEKISDLLKQWPQPDKVKIHLLAELAAGQGQESFLSTFRSIFEWALRQILIARAKGTESALPEALKPAASALRPCSLEKLTKLCETLKRHFDTAEHANLDRRLAILGAFGILAD